MVSMTLILLLFSHSNRKYPQKQFIPSSIYLSTEVTDTMHDSVSGRVPNALLSQCYCKM